MMFPQKHCEKMCFCPSIPKAPSNRLKIKNPWPIAKGRIVRWEGHQAERGTLGRNRAGRKSDVDL